MSFIPAWFNESVYLTNKLAQLKSVDPTTTWTETTLKAAIRNNDMSTYEHFLQFGAAENVSPNANFNAAEYLAAKAALMNSKSEGGRTDWTEASVAKAITDTGMTVWSHYQQYGSAEGVNPSNAFDAKAYLTAKAAAMTAAGEKQADGSDWTADAVAKAIADNGMSVLDHYETFKGTGTSEVAANAVYAVAASNKVVVSDGFDAYKADRVIEVYTIKDAASGEADNFKGTTDNDVVAGKFANIGATDKFVDSTTTDHDVMNLDGERATNLALNGATVSGFEQINVTTGSYSNLSLAADEFKGATGMTVKATESSFNTLKVENAGALNLTATGAKAVSVEGLTTGTVDAGTAATVTVAGAINGAKVVSSAEKLALVTDSAATNLTIEKGIAGAQTVTLKGEATASNTFTTAGTGDLTLKADAANFGATADKIVKGNTGTLNVELTGAAAADISGIKADSVSVADTTAGTIKVSNGQNVTLKAATGSVAFQETATSGKDSLNLTLSGTSYAALISAATDSLSGIDNLNIALTGSSDVTLTAGLTGKNIALTGAQKATLGTVTATTKFDAAAYTGDLTATVAATTAEYDGGTGKDAVSLTAGVTANQIIKTGAGDDTVTLMTSQTVADKMTLSIDLGEGKNTVTGAGTAAISGTLDIAGGSGVDTITLGAVSASGALTINTLAGDDKITLGDVTIAASDASVVINAGDGADTITLGSVAASQGTLSINGGAGDDTLVLTGDYSAATHFSFSDIEHITTAATTLKMSAAQLTGKTLDISTTGTTALTVKAAATDTVIDLANVKVNMTADTIDLSGATLSGLTKVVGTNANDTFDFGTMASGVFTGTLDGGTGTDTIAIGASAASGTIDLTKATVTGIEAVTFGGGDNGNTLTVGNNFAGTSYAVTFTAATKDKVADVFTIDLTKDFTAVAADKVETAGQYNYDSTTHMLAYRDDDGDLIQVTLTGVATTDGVKVAADGNLNITGAIATN